MMQTQIAETPKIFKKNEAFTHQQILLDLRGFVLESSDTIFKADRNRPAPEWSLFFASLLDALNVLPMHTDEWVLPRITSVINLLEGLYDCSFMRVQYCDMDSVIVWNIMNKTSELAALQAFQQRLNESRL